MVSTAIYRSIAVYNPHLEQIRKEHYYDHSSDEKVVSLLGCFLIYHNTTLDEMEVAMKHYNFAI